LSEKDFRDKTAIVGIGYSRGAETPGGFSRNSGVDVTTLAVRAVREACADAGIDVKDIDGTVTYQVAEDSVLSYDLVPALGCRENNYASNLSGGGNYSSFAVLQAAQAVYHGICNCVLVYRAINGRSGSVRHGRRGADAGSGAGRVGGPRQFSSVYGLAGAPSDFAFQARRYMHLYGVTSLDFARFAVNSRSNAVKNPRAMMRTAITVDDHQNSPLISAPYHLLDCCLETDVGCALLVTRAERAKSLRRRPILVTAGQGGYCPLDDIVETFLIQNGPRLLQAADVALGDIDIYLGYDNFTDMPMRLFEDMGWCRRGETRDFVIDGRIALDGDIPFNPHGGLMNEGYCHGLNNVLEAVQQLRGEAEDLCPRWQMGEHTYDREICRQVRDPEIALNVSNLGLSALILKRG
jgi:acetyl-CoA acetyltransferase